MILFCQQLNIVCFDHLFVCFSSQNKILFIRRFFMFIAKVETIDKSTIKQADFEFNVTTDNVLYMNVSRRAVIKFQDGKMREIECLRNWPYNKQKAILEQLNSLLDIKEMVTSQPTIKFGYDDKPNQPKEENSENRINNKNVENAIIVVNDVNEANIKVERTDIHENDVKETDAFILK
jgi:hypothetical protein